MRTGILSILIVLVNLVLFSPVVGQEETNLYKINIKKAQSLYNAGEYDKARVLFLNIKNVDALLLTELQLKEINSWVSKCERAIKKRTEYFELGIYELDVPYRKSEQTVSVRSGGKWMVVQCPDWISFTTSRNKVVLQIWENPYNEAREDSLVFTMGQKERILRIMQEGRPIQTSVVSIGSNPANSTILINRERYKTPITLDLKPGTYPVSVFKDGYQDFDSILVVEKDKPLSVDFNIKPRFSKLSFDISPEDGYSFTSVPEVYISDNKIDLFPSKLHSFDSGEDIEYYSLYSGNVIPVRSGKYVVSVKSDGFIDEVRNIELHEGESKFIPVKMKAITGYFTVIDDGNSTGADIVVDGIKMGRIPQKKLRLRTGNHIVRFVKNGYRTDSTLYHVNIEPGQEAEMNIDMHQYAVYHIESNPASAQVSIDGELKGFTPIDVEISEGCANVSIAMPDYFTISKDLDVIGGQNDTLSVILKEKHSIEIVADENNLRVDILQDEEILLEDGTLPMTVDLPYSDEKYTIILKRRTSSGTKERIAYKGKFLFNEEHHTPLKILTFSKSYGSIIGGNYNISSLLIPVNNETELLGQYRNIADAHIGKFKICPGLSTNVIKGSLFTIGSDGHKVLPGTDKFTDMKLPTLLPAISCVFINEELRIGGALHKNFDCGLLCTYAWYPDLSSFAPFSHISGHDCFWGVELSSRIPVFNVSIRAGYQMLKANVHYYRNMISDTRLSSTKEQFTSLPFNQSAFVVTIGFTLGTKDSKGNNYIRIF